MRVLPVIALSAALLAGACTDPYGRPDPGATLGLVAGAAALGGLAYVATRDHDDGPRYRRAPNYGYQRGYGGGHHGGYYGPSRGW